MWLIQASLPTLSLSDLTNSSYYLLEPLIILPDIPSLILSAEADWLDRYSSSYPQSLQKNVAISQQLDPVVTILVADKT
jgi:hypothetical protein